VLRDGHPGVRFIGLVGGSHLLASGLAGRTGHFMPASLPDSQLASFEPLQQGEPGDSVEVGSARQDIERAALALLRG
jgi:gluconokinase